MKMRPEYMAGFRTHLYNTNTVVAIVTCKLGCVHQTGIPGCYQTAEVRGDPTTDCPPSHRLAGKLLYHRHLRWLHPSPLSRHHEQANILLSGMKTEKV